MPSSPQLTLLAAALALEGIALALAVIALTRPRRDRPARRPAPTRGGYSSPPNPPPRLPRVPGGPGPGRRRYCGQISPSLSGTSEPCTLEPHPGSPMHRADNGMTWWYEYDGPDGPAGAVTVDRPLTDPETARLRHHLTDPTPAREDQ